MKSAAALFGLFRRPFLIATSVYLVALAGFVLLWGVRDDPASIVAIWLARSPTPDLLHAMWREVVLIPFCVGVLMGIAADDLRRAMFAWSLPALGSRLRIGAVSLIASLAMLVAIPHVRFGGWTNGVAAFSIAVLAAAIGLTLTVPKYQSNARQLAFLVVASGAAWPGVVASVTSANAIVVSLVSMVGTATLLVDMFSLEASRAYATARLRGSSFGAGGMPQNHARRSPLQGAGIADWIRASAYSTGIGARWMIAALLINTVNGAMAYTVGSAAFIAVTCFGDIGGQIGQPGGTLLYPVSRARRSHMSYWMNLGQMGFACVMSGGAMLLLSRFRPWSPFSGPGRNAAAAVPILALILGWSPVVLWLKCRPPVRPVAEVAPFSARLLLVGYLPFISLVMFSGWLYNAMAASISAGARALCVVALIASTQLAFYVYLRHAFATRDLV